VFAMRYELSFHIPEDDIVHARGLPAIAASAANHTAVFLHIPCLDPPLGSRYGF
jgi:hypothetical protein